MGGGQTPLLSIIVPVYNVEKYLRECLDSLVNQTLQNIEIIVVNDCSPDNSEAIVLEYVAKDDRIVYIKHEQNKCLGGARNTGIKEARGKYIAFVDSDDYVDRHLYEAAVSAFEEHNVDVVSVPFIKFDEQGRRESCYKPCDHVYTVNLDELHGGTFYSAWSKVYRTADLRDKDIVFPEHMYWEDVPFWIEYCALMHPHVWNLNDQYGFYWYRWSSLSIVGRGSMTYKDIPLSFIGVYHSLRQRGLMTSEVFFSFYKVVMNNFAEAAIVLKRRYAGDFAENLNKLLDEVHSSLCERKSAPLWHYIAKKKSKHARFVAAKRLLSTLKLKSQIKDLYRSIRKLLYLQR